MTYRSDIRQSATQQLTATSVQAPAERKPAASFVDNRASASTHIQLKAMMDACPRHDSLRALKQITAPAQRVVNEELLQSKFETVQRVKEEELLQGKLEAVQRAGMEEEEPLQGKFAESAPAQLSEQEAPKANHTGLPDQLKSGIENLSGMSMAHVKVHYNSSQPAQLNAHAYAQGSEIHVAPGQEQHVPHEAWHVVQQAQGRVKPTKQMKGGGPVNDDSALEAEADQMGQQAMNMNTRQAVAGKLTVPAQLAGLTVQYKPANFYRSYRLPMKQDKFDGFKGERSPHIANDLNRLRAGKVINAPQEFIGGHLLKAEFGGADVADNVVPWTRSAENRFGSYEDTYKKRITAHYNWLRSSQPDQLDRDGNWMWRFHLNVQYEDVDPGNYFRDDMGYSETEKAEICEAMSAIPESVMVNPGNTIDYFENSGSGIRGPITVNPKPKDFGKSVAPKGEITLDNIVEVFSNRFRQNLDLFHSKGDALADEVKQAEWGEELNVFWLESFLQSLNRLSVAVATFPVVRMPVEAPMRRLLTNASFYTRQPELTKAWESMRREVLENPVEIGRMSLDSAKLKIKKLIARYEAILKNTLFDFNSKLQEL